MKIIGLHGKKRHGKDTVADIAADILALPYNKISPADKLKQLLCETLGLAYGYPDEAVALMNECKDSWKIRATRVSVGTLRSDFAIIDREIASITGRQLLQLTGDGARKVFGADFWVDQVLPPLGAHRQEDEWHLRAKYPGIDLLLIPSVRYPNEAQRVKDWGGVVWEVVRPGMPDDDNFISEQRLPDHLIDYTITNDWGLERLRDKTAEAIQATL